MNISESSMIDALLAAGRRSRVIHMNETHHFRLGTGHADLPAIYRALKASAFDGYKTVYSPLVSQDVFRNPDTAADRPDLAEVMGEQLRLLEKIEASVDAEQPA